MTDETYWTEIARHPQGYVLFDTFDNPMRPPWILLKLMRPKTPGRRIARRVWLQWNADKQLWRELRSPMSCLKSTTGCSMCWKRRQRESRMELAE